MAPPRFVVPSASPGGAAIFATWTVGRTVAVTVYQDNSRYYAYPEV